MFGHWAEILVILVVGLLVFGPKKMVDIGSAAGKAFNELRQSTKDLNLSSLLNPEAEEQPSTLNRLSQISQTLMTRGDEPSDTPVVPTASVVDEHPEAPISAE